MPIFHTRINYDVKIVWIYIHVQWIKYIDYDILRYSKSYPVNGKFSHERGEWFHSFPDNSELTF